MASIKDDRIGRLEERISSLEETIEKLWCVEKRLLEEVSMLKNSIRRERRERNRLQHIVLSIIEETRSLNEINRIGELIEKYFEENKVEA